MNENLPAQQVEKAFASLGRELSATTDAESAAQIIVKVADELIGWDACYLILYDPAQKNKPRPILVMDTIDGVRQSVSSAMPEKPSVNMQRAIQEDGFLTLSEEPIEVERAYSFGGARRTLSHLFVPVRSGERTIGIFSIQSYQKNAYNEKSLETFKALANQCAGALERIWAQEALADVQARRALLYQAAQAISASLELEQLYEVIYQTVLKVMPCDDFIICAYDEPNNRITPLYVIEHLARLTLEPYIADHGLGAYIIHAGKSCLFNSNDEINATGLDFVVFTQSEDSTQSILAVPMILYGKTIGMISAQSYAANAYTKDDQSLLELLTAHAAVAIENARLFAKIQQLADMDTLTRAATRRKFYEIAEREFSRSRRHANPLAVIMLDVDNFKKFNDTFGHKAGDFILQAVTEQCKNCIREVDVLARHGGEEFIILLPDTNLADATIVAKRLCECVELAKLIPAHDSLDAESTASAGGLPNVTISVGVAALDERCIDIDALVDHADRAMYTAKKSGRNRVAIWNQGK